MSRRLIATSDTTKWKLPHIRIVGDREALLSGWAYYNGSWHCASCRG